MNIKKQTWHYKVYAWAHQNYVSAAPLPNKNNLCPYFWSCIAISLMFIPAYPLLCLLKWLGINILKPLVKKLDGKFEPHLPVSSLILLMVLTGLITWPVTRALVCVLGGAIVAFALVIWIIAGIGKYLKEFLGKMYHKIPVPDEEGNYNHGAAFIFWGSLMLIPLTLGAICIALPAIINFFGIMALTFLVYAIMIGGIVGGIFSFAFVYDRTKKSRAKLQIAQEVGQALLITAQEQKIIKFTFFDRILLSLDAVLSGMAEGVGLVVNFIKAKKSGLCPEIRFVD